MKPKISDRHIPFFALTVGTVLMFHRFFLGEVLFWGTPYLQFYPWRNLAFNLIRSGQLPFWNPMVGFGAPLLANLQTAIFYPPHWLYLLIPAEYAQGVIVFLHVIWAGSGMILLLREYGVSSLGQTIGGLAYALGGYLIIHVLFLSMTVSVPWLPWIVLAVERLMMAEGSRSQVLERVSTLGLFVGLNLLAGHAQTSFYSLLFAGCYALWRTFTDETSGRLSKVSRLAYSLLAVGLGFGIAMIQLLPTYELMQISHRAEGVDAEFLDLSFAFVHFMTFLSPNIFGAPGLGNGLIGSPPYWENTLYIGFLPFVLAFQGVARWIRSIRKGTPDSMKAIIPFMFGSVVIAFVLALGIYTPIFPWLYENVPTFDLFRAPTRWSLLAVFSLSVLAGIGIDDLKPRHWGMFWTRLATAAGGGIFITVFVAQQMLADTIEQSMINGVLRLGAVFILYGVVYLILPQLDKDTRYRTYWTAGVIVFVIVDLVTALYHANPTTSPELYHLHLESDEPTVEATEGYRTVYLPSGEQEIKFEHFFSSLDYKADDETHWLELRESLLPNVGMYAGIRSGNNDDPLQVGFSYQLLQAIDELPEEQQIGTLASINVAVLISPNDHDLPVLEELGVVTAYQLPDPTPRLYLGDCKEEADGWICPPQSIGVVEIAREEAHRIEIEADVDEPGYLVLLDTYYPGWEAEIDGEATDIIRVNQAFRAIAIAPGKHQVTFSYHSTNIKIGLIISLLSIYVVIGMRFLGDVSRSGTAG